MRETQTLRTISVNDLLHEVKRYLDQNARIIQIGCTQNEAVFEINYSFDVHGSFENIRIETNGDEMIPSVSNLYFCAFLYENEIHDLYGISFEGIALDYQGTLIKTAKLHPFRMDPSELKVKPKGKAAAAKKAEDETKAPSPTPEKVLEDETSGEVAESSKEESKENTGDE